MVEAARVVEGLRAGRGAVCFIEGEAGIGKSRVVAELASLARSYGCAVITGAATEFERNRPFGPLLDAFAIDERSGDPDRSPIARLLNLQPNTDRAASVGLGPGLHYQAIAALVDLVEVSVSDAPMLLALEDLHWSEASTALVIHALARRLEALPVAVVCTFRPSPRPSALTQLVSELELQSVHIRLGPLSPVSVTSLVTALVGADPGPQLRHAVDKAGGNPLFVTELVCGLEETGALVESGTAVELADFERERLPATLASTILRRVNAVPADVVDLLRVASVLGSTLSVADLAAVAARPAASLLQPLEEAGEAGVLDTSGERLAFRHDLVRDALYQSIPLALRLGLHRDAGRALALPPTSAPHSRTRRDVSWTKDFSTRGARWCPTTSGRTSKRWRAPSTPQPAEISKASPAPPPSGRGDASTTSVVRPTEAQSSPPELQQVRQDALGEASAACGPAWAASSSSSAASRRSSAVSGERGDTRGPCWARRNSGGTGARPRSRTARCIGAERVRFGWSRARPAGAVAGPCR